MWWFPKYKLISFTVSIPLSLSQHDIEVFLLVIANHLSLGRPSQRDKVLSDAIQAAIARGLPLDSLSSSRRDYQTEGRLASVVGNQRVAKKRVGSSSTAGTGGNRARPSTGGDNRLG